MTLVVVAGLTMGAALLTPRTFSATASLMVGADASAHSSEGAPRIGRMLESFAKIAGSDDVLRDAIHKVGLNRLLDAPPAAQLDGVADPSKGADWSGKLGASSAWVGGRGERAPDPALDQALPEILKALTIKAEMSSDIIDVTFRHKDPAIAAEFANAVADGFIDRQLHLFSLGQTAGFYDQQSSLFNAELKRAADEFERFMVTNRAFAIDQQKELLLKRASNLSTAVLATRSALADKSGQAEALADQLHRLKPVTRSSYASSVVDALIARPGAAAGKGRETAASGEPPVSAGNTPPLLMIKVFEDSMVLLFKTNADLTGLRELESEQTRQLAGIDAELASLVAKEAQFNKLKRAVAQASLNAETYAKRAAEQRVDANMSAAKFSEVKVIQTAYPPLKSNFPGLSLITLLALANGLLVGVAAALSAEFMASRKSPDVRPAVKNVWDVRRDQDLREALREG